MNAEEFLTKVETDCAGLSLMLEAFDASEAVPVWTKLTDTKISESNEVTAAAAFIVFRFVASRSNLMWQLLRFFQKLRLHHGRRLRRSGRVASGLNRSA